MKMVMLTIMEARHVLSVLDYEDVDSWAQQDRREAVEIMEEALLQPQEVDIG